MSYIHDNVDLEIKPKLGESIYKSTPNNFLRGKRCPRCNESHGEHVIERYLIQHHIKYITQKRFQGCVYRHTLPFDFYLLEYHQAIEYDGFQHHHLENFGGRLSRSQQVKALKLRMKRDRIKTNFCRTNKNLRKLLRIPAPSRNPPMRDVKKRVYKYLNEYFNKHL